MRKYKKHMVNGQFNTNLEKDGYAVYEKRVPIVVPHTPQA